MLGVSWMEPKHRQGGFTLYSGWCWVVPLFKLSLEHEEVRPRLRSWGVVDGKPGSGLPSVSRFCN